MENQKIKIAWFEKVDNRGFGCNHLEFIDEDGMTNLIETPCIHSGFFQYEINETHDNVNICTGNSVISSIPPINMYCKKIFDYYNMTRLPVSEWGIGDTIYPVSYEPSSGNFYIELHLDEKFINPVFAFNRGKDILYGDINKSVIAEEFNKRLRDLPMINCKRPISYDFINATLTDDERYEISRDSNQITNLPDVYNYHDKFVFREIHTKGDETEYVVMYTDPKSLKKVYLYTDVNKEHSVPFLKYICNQFCNKSVMSNIPIISNGYRSKIKQIY